MDFGTCAQRDARVRIMIDSCTLSSRQSVQKWSAPLYRTSHLQGVFMPLLFCSCIRFSSSFSSGLSTLCSCFVSAGVTDHLENICVDAIFRMCSSVSSMRGIPISLLGMSFCSVVLVVAGQ